MGKEIFFYNSTSPTILEKGKEVNPSMMEYLKELDPIELKYQTQKGSRLSQRSKALAAEYEIHHQFGNLSKREYSYMQENLRLVYGLNNPEVENDIRTYHEIEKKIIFGYLGIPQLSRIFDEDYFNFEWDMHVGQNFREHRNDYYRDHFIHQIRNLYMMVNMLDCLDFDVAICHIFKQPKASRISEYVNECLYIFMGDKKNDVFQLLENIHSEERKTEDKTTGNPESIAKETLKEYEEDYFYKYIIYASSILSALFHDMGYPICHFLELRHRTSAYNPAMYMFTHNAVESFDQIAAKLGGSLLFTIVDQEEIRQRLEPGKKGKYDHGAYSAIAFLLQFYETGLIHSLGQEKKCAIEMAALAIYNHTGKYRSINSKAETNKYAMVFFQNPVSFLLRFCDDLQEWDRRYFEISEASDFMFCPQCGLPLIRTKKKEKQDTDEQKELNISEYSCDCVKGQEQDHPLVRPNIFYKRKLFIVTVADWVRFSQKENAQNLQVTIYYDLYKLLILSTINNEYARHRLEDLKDLKKLVGYQNFHLMSDGILPIESIKIRYFMSANPICIKIKILEEYLSRIDWEKEGIDSHIRMTPLGYQGVLEQIETLIGTDEARAKFIENIGPLRDLKCPEELEKTIENSGILLFYLKLLRIQMITAARKNEGTDSTEEKYRNELRNSILPEKDKHSQYYEAISVLIDDCLCAVNGEEEDKKKDWLFHESQNEDLDKEILYFQIKVYTDSRNYFNLYGKESQGMIGFYKDIYLFYLMNTEMRWKKESSLR